MTAGLPGVGIGGIFYVVSALLMPVRSAVLTVRGRGAEARWGLALRQAGIALGIVGALWVTGWALGALIASAGTRVMSATGAANGAEAVRHAVRIGAFALSLVTLTLVVGVVQVARMVVPRPARTARREARRQARAAALFFALFLGGALTCTAAAQQPADAAARHVAAADAAFRADNWDRAEREYSLALAADSGASRAYYQLARIRRDRDPAGAAMLLRRYVALVPRDAWGYAALGDALARAGRNREALREYDRAASLDAEAVDAKRVQSLRARVAGTAEPVLFGGRDSDGNTQLRAGARVTTPELPAGARFWVSGGSKRVANLDSTGAVSDVQVGLQFRPLPSLRIEGGIGAAMLPAVTQLPAPGTGTGPGAGTGPGGTSGKGTGNGRGRGRGTTTTPSVMPALATLAQAGTTLADGPALVGQLRARWRATSGAASLDLRGGRTLLDATPLLVSGRAWRDEVGGEGDVRLFGPLHARAFGRTGRVVTAWERNTRDLVGGAAVLDFGAIQLSGRGQQISYGAPSVAGYFAPEKLRVMEATAYMEHETARGIVLAADLGAGGQQVTDWGAAAGSWSPSLRGWGQLVAPLGPGRSLGVEVDTYDAMTSPETGLAQAAGRWRYGSASVWLRVAY